MTALATEPLPIVRTSVAAALARRRWDANLAALMMTPSELLNTAGDIPTDVEWVIARDGALTALTADGAWHAGCSVPRAAARKLLVSLERSPLVSAYLAPAHAELIHAARAQMGPEATMIAVVPSVDRFRILLATGDFAADIAAHRLWFVVGDDWAEALRKLLVDRPGLPPAGRFIRTKLTDASVTDPMISAAQDVFSTIAKDRAARLEAVREMPRRADTGHRRALLIAPSRYRLWDDASEAIDDIAAELRHGGWEAVRFDSDEPLNCSPLALALAATECDAVFAANVFRADATLIVADDTPWFTWSTRTPVAPCGNARDRIIVADSSLASAAAENGWAASAVLHGRPVSRAKSATLARPHLAVIADFNPVVMPRHIDDLSSHRLLWGHIEAEIESDPFVIGDDPVGYLMRHAVETGIHEGELDLKSFVDGLIVPCWQRSIVNRLAGSGVSLVVYGCGWENEPALAKLTRGPVADRTTLDRARDDASALLHVWPGVRNHPIETSGHRVIVEKRSWQRLVEAVQAAVRKPAPASHVSSPHDAVRVLLGELSRSDSKGL